MWSGAFPAHWVATDRYGFGAWGGTGRAESAHRPGVSDTSRSIVDGASQAPYDRFNIADHVGDSAAAVAHNRHLFAQRLGRQLADLAVIRAEHGSHTAEISRDGLPAIPVADALVTTDPSLVLVALAADCVPIVLADQDQRVAGVAHCGWRGVVAGIVPSVISEMNRLGAGNSTITALIGPSICGSCYDVGPECAELVAACVPESVRTNAGRITVDLAGAVARQLADQGIQSHVIGGCTYTSPNLYSYRRDTTTGRHAMAVRLPSLDGTRASAVEGLR